MSKKILLVHPFDPIGKKIGGIEVYVNEFLKNIPDDFVTELVGVTTDKINRPVKKWTELDFYGKKIRFFPVLFVKNQDIKPKIPLSLRFTIALLLSRIDYKNRVVFFNRIEPSIVFTKKNNPKILMVHNDVQEQIYKKDGEVYWNKIPGIYRILEKYLISGLDYIYSANNRLIEYYKRIYKKDKFFFLPSSMVDENIFFISSEDKKVLKEKIIKCYGFIPHAKTWILFTGRLEKQKSPLKLVEVFSEFQKRQADSVLIIIGDGSLKDAVNNRIEKLGLSKKIVTVPYLDRYRIADFCRASDVFLLTSLYENLPFSIIEALSCGLPVVTTDVGEVRRVVKEGFSGIVAGTSEIDDIAEALVKIIKDRDRFSNFNCKESVNYYNPVNVLGPLYKLMRSL